MYGLNNNILSQKLSKTPNKGSLWNRCRRWRPFWLIWKIKNKVSLKVYQAYTACPALRQHSCKNLCRVLWYGIVLKSAWILVPANFFFYFFFAIRWTNHYSLSGDVIFRSLIFVKCASSFEKYLLKDIFPFTLFYALPVKWIYSSGHVDLVMHKVCRVDGQWSPLSTVPKACQFIWQCTGSPYQGTLKTQAVNIDLKFDNSKILV